MIGAGLLAGAVLAILLAAHGGAMAGGAALAAVVLTLAFIAAERRAKDPVLPLSLFSYRPIAIGSVVGALFTAAMLAGSTYLPLYVQGVLGGTPTEGGQILSPMLFLWPVCATAAGYVIPRLGFRPLVVTGLGLAALANLGLALWMSPKAPLWLPMAAMGLFGAGLGFASTAVMLAVQTSVGWEMRGVATASNMFFRTIGGTIGVGVLGGVLSAGIQADPAIPANAGSELLGPTHGANLPPEALRHLSVVLEQALGVGFWIMAGCTALAFVAGLLFPRVERSKVPPPGQEGAAGHAMETMG